MQFIRLKLKNMTFDMRHKTSKFLADNYKTIIYPIFNIKSMCDKKYRNIGKHTARRMYLWSHYKFRELLKYKTALRGGTVVDCHEEYTSKTCSCCGKLNHTLGASKSFTCPFCHYVVDRDVVHGIFFLKIITYFVYRNRLSDGWTPTIQVLYILLCFDLLCDLPI